MKHKVGTRLGAFFLFVVLLIPVLAPAVSAQKNTVTVSTVSNGDQAFFREIALLNAVDGEGIHRLDEPITRQEMFRVMAILRQGGVTEAPDMYYWDKLVSSGIYKDLDQIDQEYRQYAAYCVFNRIFIGNEKAELEPRRALNYVECVAVLLRLLGLPESQLKGRSYYENTVYYNQLLGLTDGVSDEDMSSPVTWRNLSRVFHVALRTRCISGLENRTPVYTDRTMLQKLYGISDLDACMHFGILVGRENDLMQVANGTGITHFPYDSDLFAACYGKPVWWSETDSGETLHAFSLWEPVYTVKFRLEDLQDPVLRDDGVLCDVGSDILFFPVADRSITALSLILPGMETAMFREGSVFEAVSLLRTVAKETMVQNGTVTLSLAGDLLAVTVEVPISPDPAEPDGQN